jgi:hypothetical protein
MEVSTNFFNGSIWTNFIKAEADRAAAAEQANADGISSMNTAKESRRSYWFKLC